jgi:hypothetical protein
MCRAPAPVVRDSRTLPGPRRNCRSNVPTCGARIYNFGLDWRVWCCPVRVGVLAAYLRAGCRTRDALGDVGEAVWVSDQPGRRRQGQAIVTRSGSETGAATVPGPTRPAVNCRRRTRHAPGILYFCRSADCVDTPGGQVTAYRQVKGSQSLIPPGRCDHALVTQSTGTRVAVGPYPGFWVSFRFRLVGMRGAAAGDHEGEPRRHWPWALWLNTVTLLAVRLECVVLIYMAGQRLP